MFFFCLFGIPFLHRTKPPSRVPRRTSWDWLMWAAYSWCWWVEWALLVWSQSASLCGSHGKWRWRRGWVEFRIQKRRGEGDPLEFVSFGIGVCLIEVSYCFFLSSFSDDRKSKTRTNETQIWAWPTSLNRWRVTLGCGREQEQHLKLQGNSTGATWMRFDGKLKWGQRFEWPSSWRVLQLAQCKVDKRYFQFALWTGLECSRGTLE